MRRARSRRVVPVAVAIDPGKWKIGCAVALDGVVAAAFPILVPKSSDWSPHTAAAQILQDAPYTGVWWIEEPKARPGGRESVKADVEDLQALAKYLKRELRPQEANLLDPFAWKRQVPKAVHHRRIRGHLSEAERLIVDAGAARNAAACLDVLDAVGILLYGLGRTDAGATRA